MSTSPHLAPARIACVLLPALPLQLLLLDHPRWRRLPVAVVDEERPQGTLLWVNEQARQLRVLPGMRYAAAQSLAAHLRAAVVPRERLDEALGELFVALHAFSPRVEPSLADPGLFWMDPAGLVPLYGTLEEWGAAVHRQLRASRLQATVIVGFHRDLTQAIARTHHGHWVLPTPEREQAMAAALPLDRLDLSAKLRDQLALLGIVTLRDLLALPHESLRTNLGDEAAALVEMAVGGPGAPLQPRPLAEAISESIELDPPELDLGRLLFRIKPVLDTLVARLAAQAVAMSALHLELRLERDGVPASAAPDELPPRSTRTPTVSLSPAAPTLDARHVLDLLRLRLDSLTLAAPVESLRLELTGVHALPRQLALFHSQQRRDLDAGARALARLRASFGDEAVTRAKLRDAHLPEASFLWAPATTLVFPHAAPAGTNPLPLVRCLFARPLPLPSPPRGYDAWPLGPQHSAMTDLHGPLRISGGWWIKLVERDYYFAHTQHEDLLWIYYDRPRRRWYQHGYID